MDAFEPGDVVQLKSGGPEMTVTSIPTPESVECAYFQSGQDNQEKVRYVTIPAAALKRVPHD